MSDDRSRHVSAEAALAQKVALLSRPDAYGSEVRPCTCRETHMSWVFLAGAARLQAQEAGSLFLPRISPRWRAAKRHVVPNSGSIVGSHRMSTSAVETAHRRPIPGSCSGALSLGGSGQVVDWLVVMRRLDERETLENALEERSDQAWQLDRLVATLVQFYRRTAPVSDLARSAFVGLEEKPGRTIAGVLLEPQFRLPAGLIAKLDAIQRRFLVATSGSAGHARAGPAHSWTDMVICVRNTFGSAIRSGSSTASNSTIGCARSTRWTKSRS